MQIRLSARWLCGLTCIATVWFILMFVYLDDLFADEVKDQGHLDPSGLSRSPHDSNGTIDDVVATASKHSLDRPTLNIAPPNIMRPYQPVSLILPDQEDVRGKKKPKKGHKRTKPKSPYIRRKSHKHRLSWETVTFRKARNTGNASLKAKVKANAHWVGLKSSRIQAPFKQRGVMVYLGYSESHDLRLDLERSMDRHSFNVTLSHYLPLNRAIPDYRPASCLKRSPDVAGLPSVSIIICFHNEALSALLRTVWSALYHSPASVVQDVILVDDNSTFDYLRGELESYLSHWPKVRLFRTHQREGLVRARLLGVSHAKGDVLVFLDSHCECNTDWLLPLLYTVQLQPTRVAVPELDIIDPDTLAYTPAPGNLHGSFDWNLKYVWKPLPWNVQSNASHLPIRTPTMIGGVFAIARQFFQHLGGYDPGLEIWGGENLQLSFKVWQCGGSIQILPCSRVGHLFRRVMPYGFPQGGKATIQRNAARVAEIWLDEYKIFFYASQMFQLSTTGQLYQRYNCVAAAGRNAVIVKPCPFVSQRWTHYQAGHLSTVNSKGAQVCLGLNADRSKLVLQPCITHHDPSRHVSQRKQQQQQSQQWSFTHHFDKRITV